MLLFAGITDTGGNNGNANLAFKRFIEAGTENDVGFFVNFFLNAAGSFVDFKKGNIGAAGDVNQNTFGTVHIAVIQQRIGQSLFGGFNGAFVAFGLAGAHDGFAFILHDRFDVGKVKVYQAGHHHQVGNGADAGIQNIVRHDKGIGQSGVFVGNAKQILVGDDDDTVDGFGKFFNRGFGSFHAFAALELKWFGDNADGQNAFFLGQFGHHGSRTGACAAAHAGSDKDHVGAFKLFFNLFFGFFRRHFAYFRTSAGSQSLCGLKAELNFAAGRRMSQSLRIGVGHNKIDSFQILGNHVVDGITAAAADSDNGDARFQVGYACFRNG